MILCFLANSALLVDSSNSFFMTEISSSMHNKVGITLVGLVTALMTLTEVNAASRIFDLHLKNVNSVPVSFTLSATGHNCYQGSAIPGEKYSNIAPGRSVKITLARVQGHGCNGHNGIFVVEFDPSEGHRNKQHFVMDNGGTLALDTRYANAYPGRLSQKYLQDESYTYTTIKREKESASKPVGSWETYAKEFVRERCQKR